MTQEEFKNYLLSINITEVDEKIKKFKQYYEYLTEYNKHTNLTTIIDQKEVYLKHFFDSAIILKYYDLSNLKILDFGTGAGFPGLALAILMPNSHFTLVDSVGKKTKFLENLKTILKLDNIEIINQRIEELNCNSEIYDYVIVRAVAKINILLELSAKYLKVGGSLIAMKANLNNELNEAEKAIKKLGLAHSNTHRYQLPFDEANRTLVDIKKIKPTPLIYPRNYGKIKKNPL